MSLPEARCRERLGTVFGTVLYVDEASGELRHGALDGSPANAVLAGDGRSLAESRQLWLLHEGECTAAPIICAAEASRSGKRAAEAAVPLAATTFEALEAEADQLALRGGGLYLCAELDGRVTHSRRDCGAWERFRPVGATAPAPLQAIFPGSVSARYHLGCGPFVIPGFLNLDQLADMPEGQVFANFGSVPGAFFANCDLSRGIPGRDNSLEVVYHCHFLEHLTYGDAIKLLRQARLRLKPGGLMRVVVPDLELWIDNYRINNTAFFDDYRRLVLGNNVGLYRTKGAVFMGMLHNHGHKCGYDFETLSWLLHELGFANIRRTGFREGSMPDLLTAEPDRLLRSMESLCIECEKPPLAGPEPVGIDAAIG